jgi:hypothetical protein
MNATDQHDYIVAGFAALRAHLEAVIDGEPVDRIKSNTKAREVARNRVWREYAELGIGPPHDDALSITALRVLGLPLPQPATEETAA